MIRSETIISYIKYKYTHMRKMSIKYAARNGAPFFKCYHVQNFI